MRASQKERDERKQQEVERAVAEALAEEKKRRKTNGVLPECPPCHASECQADDKDQRGDGKLNTMYAVLARTRGQLENALAKVKASPTANPETVAKIKGALATTTTKIEEINDEYDLMGTGMTALDGVGDLVEKAIIMAGELNEEYQLSDRSRMMFESVQRRMEKAAARPATDAAWSEEMLSFLEGYLGPRAAMLYLAGSALFGLYIILNLTVWIFRGNRGPEVQTYYHSQEDDELEQRMGRNVTYLSPMGPDTPTHGVSPGSRKPPTASLGMQKSGGIFSSGGSSTTPLSQRQWQSSPFSNSNGADTVYSPTTSVRHHANNATPGSQGSNGKQRRSPYDKY